MAYIREIEIDTEGNVESWLLTDENRPFTDTYAAYETDPKTGLDTWLYDCTGKEIKIQKIKDFSKLFKIYRESIELKGMLARLSTITQ